MSKIPTRDEAFALLLEYNKTDALINHALAVEGVMIYFAEKNGEDKEKWGIIGLLHDLDYELYPEDHCKKTSEILKELDYDEAYIRAIMSHGFGICTDVEPIHQMEKLLYATDELCGLINAAVLMRPNKSVMDFELKSLEKKYKSPSFAARVDRSIIENGAKMLDMELDVLLSETIQGMRTVAEKIGIGGE